MTTTTARQVSDKQMAFVIRLLAEKDLTGTAYAGWTPDWTKATSSTTSGVISFLMSLPRVAAPAAAPVAGDAPEGMHKFGGVFFKVQQAKNGSGHRYAKALVEDGQGDWSFEYVAGAIRNLSTETRMDASEAARFGALYGVCVNCARALTDETSIGHGYGPVCAANNGWDYSKIAAPAPFVATEDNDGECGCEPSGFRCSAHSWEYQTKWGRAENE